MTICTGNIVHIAFLISDNIAIVINLRSGLESIEFEILTVKLLVDAKSGTCSSVHIITGYTNSCSIGSIAPYLLFGILVVDAKTIFRSFFGLTSGNVDVVTIHSHGMLAIIGSRSSIYSLPYILYAIIMKLLG